MRISMRRRKLKLSFPDSLRFIHPTISLKFQLIKRDAAIFKGLI